MVETGNVLAARAVRRDRVVVLASLGGIAAVAWLLTIYFTRRMDQMMPDDFVLASTMWFVMMAAMMLPSVSPTLILFAAILRKGGSSPSARAAVFALGYLLVWLGYSVAAALAQFVLHGAVPISPSLGAAVLVAVGIFQFTPFKRACLRRCRSPQGFFITEWREGIGGALAMGIKNGLYCLGCCWLLMALFFAAGTMNLAWMAALAILVLVEKVAPHGEWLSRAAGLILVGAGAAVAASMLPNLAASGLPMY